MNRRLTNAIRFAMDELLPPIVRDSAWLMAPLYWAAYRGKNVRRMMQLKRDIWSYTPEQYRELYEGLTSISRDRPTDLNARCEAAILSAIEPEDRRILDVGCGSGHLLRTLAARYPGREYVGLDVARPVLQPSEGITLRQGDIHRLALDPASFDVVLSCHVLEHLLDYRAAIRQMVAAARRKVIFVVPIQRPYFHTLDEHVNFFLFPEQLAFEVGLARHECRRLDGDLFYRGDITST